MAGIEMRGCALLMTAAGAISVLSACSSSASSASSSRSGTTFRATPTLTLPGLVAPPRSRTVTFTGVRKDVETAFRARLADFERKDVEEAYASEVKHSLSKAQLRSFMNSYRVRLFRINDIFVNGTDATVHYENAIVGRNVNRDAATTLLGQRDIWSKVDGRWKLLSDTALMPGIPSDLKSVTVALRDNAPIAVPAPLPATDFAFLLKNTGRAPKGVFILRVPADLPLATVVKAVGAIGALRATAGTGFPYGIVEMGATADVAGQRTGTMVFNRHLPKGKYVLMSRAGNDGALLPGETAAFTVK